MHASALIAQYGFPCVALVIFAGELGIPILIPGELVLFLAGSQLVHSLSGLVFACLAFAAVDLVATSLLHLAARSGGNWLLRFVLRRFLKDDKQPEDILNGWRARVGRHDAFVIFAVRAVPGIRLSAPVVSGLLRLRIRQFLLGAAPASVLWTAVPLALGYGMRDHLRAVQAVDVHVIYAVVIGCLVFFLAGGARWWMARQRGGGPGRLTGRHHAAS